MAGLREHIDQREIATFAECQKFGREILALNSLEKSASIEALTEFLLQSGDIGKSTVRMFETHEAQELGAGALYS